MYEDGAPYMYDYRNAVISQVEPSTVHARDTVISWYWRRWLLQKAMSLFTWKLPANWDRDYFLYCLYCWGFVAIVKTDKYGVIPQGCTLGGLNVFYRPTFALISNPLLKGILQPTIDEQCTLFKLRPDYAGILDVTSHYAELLAMCTETVATNLYNSQLAYVFAASNKAAAESFKKLYDKIHSGNPAAVIDKSLMDKDGKPTWTAFEQNIRNVFICPELQAFKKDILDEYLTLIGIPTANTEKRERLIVDEVNANNVETAIDWDRCLEGLQETCRKTCDMFGIPADELSVTWRDIATPRKATAEEVENNAE